MERWGRNWQRHVGQVKSDFLPNQSSFVSSGHSFRLVVECCRGESRGETTSRGVAFCLRNSVLPPTRKEPRSQVESLGNRFRSVRGPGAWRWVSHPGSRCCWSSMARVADHLSFLAPEGVPRMRLPQSWQAGTSHSPSSGYLWLQLWDSPTSRAVVSLSLLSRGFSESPRESRNLGKLILWIDEWASLPFFGETVLRHILRGSSEHSSGASLLLCGSKLPRRMLEKYVTYLLMWPHMTLAIWGQRPSLWSWEIFSATSHHFHLSIQVGGSFTSQPQPPLPCQGSAAFKIQSLCSDSPSQQKQSHHSLPTHRGV